jgi:hypothetical protein
MRLVPLLALSACVLAPLDPVIVDSDADSDAVPDTEAPFTQDSEATPTPTPTPTPQPDTDDPGTPTRWSLALDMNGDLSDCPAEAQVPTTAGAGPYVCVTWTSTDVYLGLSHPDVAAGGALHFAWAYLWLGDPSSTTEGVLYNTQQFTLPGPMSHHLRVKGDGSYASMMAWDGTAWADDAEFFANVGDLREGTDLEIRIPRLALGAGTELRLLAGWLYEGDNFESTYALSPPNTGDEGYDPEPATYFVVDLSQADSPADATTAP